MIAWLVGAALAGPAPADLWGTLEALGDGTAEVVARTDELRDLALATTARVDADDASLDRLRRLREEAMELDLGRLYRLLPESPGDDDLHRLPIQGWWEAPDWHLQVGASQSPPPGLGTLDAAVTLQPVPSPVDGSGRAWSASADAELSMGPLDPHTIAGLWEGALVRAQRIASTATPAPAVRHQPELSHPVDRSLWAALDSAAPTFAERLSTGVRVERMAHLDRGRLAIDSRLRIDTTGLAAGHPSLSRYLRRLGRVVEGEVRVVDAAGRSVARFGAASDDLSVSMSAVVDDGAVIPVGATGTAGPGLRLSDPRVALVMRVDMVVRSDGMEVAIRDYGFPLVWTSDGSKSSLALDVTDVPTVELSGSNGFTGWIAELADGLFDLEGHAQAVFAAVAHGPDGEGTKVRLSHGAAGDLTGSVRAVLVDNGMVRFFMRLVGRTLVPSDAVVADSYAAAEALVRALDDDWRPVRAAWLADGAEEPVDGRSDEVVEHHDFDPVGGR
ncbi:MAG: hypothetical protein ACI8PZ_005949 [Myxococcota bacterium]